jgi:hypothetical protein
MTPLATIRSYGDLVLALKARQHALGLSDATLDHVAGLTPGHTNKCLGPSRERGLGASTLEAYLIALAIDLVMVENPEKLAAMRQHYEQRSESRVRANHRIGDQVLSRAMTKLAKRRWAKPQKEARARMAGMARMAALKRWEKHMPCDTA